MTETSKIGDLLSTGESLLAQAYRRGYRDGVASAKARVVSSLADLETENGGGSQALARPRLRREKQVGHLSNGEAKSRAPRSSVRPVVLQVLAEHPGSTVAQAQRRVAQIDSRISPLSVGNEMRRNKGTLYHQRVRRWYLTEDGKRAAADIATQAPPAAAPASPSPSQGEIHGTALAGPPSE